MGKSPASQLEQIQSYVSPKELQNLDKIANASLRSRSDTVRLMVSDKIKEYAEELDIKLI